MYNSQVLGKIYTWAIEQLGMREVGGKGWLGGDCPHCGKEGKFGIHVEDNRSNCFVCGTRMNLKTLVKTVHQLKTDREFYTILDKYRGFKIHIDRPNREEPIPKDIGDDILPEGFRLLGTGNSILEQNALKQMKARGYSKSRLWALGVGYCPKGRFKHRVIIPYYEGGKVVYFNARAVSKAAPAKYLNPDELEAGIGKGHVMYNIDALRVYDKIWVFEGVLNALTVGSRGINIGGKKPSPWQLGEMIKSQAKKFVIALDDDAYYEAIELALQLTTVGKLVKILHFPEGKDANDIGRKATLKLEKQAHYMNYIQVLRLKLNYRRA